MPEMLSPDVYTTEIDNSLIAPSVSNSIAVFAGDFTKGPIGVYKLITTVDELISFYGKPTNTNYNDWYQVYNFLQYGNKIYVARAGDLEERIIPIPGEFYKKYEPVVEDSSVYKHQIKIFGDGLSYENDIVKFDFGSLRFSGQSGIYIENVNNSLVLNDAFTIDFWLYISSNDEVEFSGTNSVLLEIGNSYKFGLFNNRTQLTFTSNDVVISGNEHDYSNINLDEWNHVVLIRDNSTSNIMCYLNGVSGTGDGFAIFGDIGALGETWSFGYAHSTSNLFTKCYMDEMRVVKDLVRYQPDPETGLILVPSEPAELPIEY